MHTITRLHPHEFRASVGGLADLFADAVEGGASLGFVAPFGRKEAAAWWRGQEAAVAAGTLLVWASHDGHRVTGVVGLTLSPKPNGRHRGEIVKLMVHRAARGRGLGRALLSTAERAAAEGGVSLLLLDTETGSVADRLYGAAGWTRYGVVPAYAADPGGVLRDCSFYYKQLA
ncbi:GNAT family N-acetyltransferase [Sinosporangium siamense]|uniref:N-acetyltransferase n=1 Tax=Sinosporangium siamense TaxID=1367973 RepID=A0A919VA66_9ACTN|nr:GNAT family N-acetyltransferase [Sinosporangium siamense]GII96123.1 N-acetyltransferase [Sinosporangium siamense]